MALNFNVDPYYDDFDAAKNFHRILFKPGYAVQARELTQSQTILQDQISKFGNGIYNDGSKVSGANISFDTNIVTGKLTNAAADNIESFVGLYAVGATSKLVAKVIQVDINNYYIVTKPVNTSNSQAFASGETINFYNTKVDALSSLSTAVTPVYTYVAITETTTTKTGVSGTYLTNKLTGSNISTGSSVGDKVTIASMSNLTAVIIKIIDGDNMLISKNLTADLNTQNITIKTMASTAAMEISIDQGVWFTNGFFVRNDASSIVPEPLNLLPSAIIGFEVNENIIDSFNDSSLLDPAIAASNYQAPGADRYKISFSLVSRPYVSNQVIANLTTSKFIELVRVKNGVVENLNDTPIYSEISKFVAQGIYDQSGDFIVNPFKLVINDSLGNEPYFPASITAGKAYLNGRPVEHIAPVEYNVEKSRDTTSLADQLISTYYGNYVECKNIRGSFINFQTGTQVQLHNVAFGAANANTVIGSASVVNFDYDSGDLLNTVYKVFLSEVTLANNVFANVNSIIIPGAGNNYSSVTFSANTVSPTTINDPLYNDLLFPMPQVNLANVTNANYITRRYYSAPSFVNGVFTINTGGANEIFVGGSGALSSAERKLNYGLVVTSNSGSYTAGTFIPMDQANVSITVNNTGSPQATINIAGGFNGSATIFATISSVGAQIKNKTLNTNGYSLVSANTLNQTIELGYADIYQFKGVYELGNTISFTGAWSSGTTYSNTQAVIYSGKVYKSLTNSNSGNAPNTSLTNWTQLRNNSENYIFDNGQKDNMYDHGTITNISKVAKGNVVAVFDYFTHSGGLGYITLDSYPLNYALIPTFTSKKYGATYNLRDYLDFRPRRSDGIGTKTFDNFELPAPFEDVYTDYAYYLNRVDKIVLYPNGQFKTLRGISSYENPVPPADIPGALTLFKLDIPAYTFKKSDVVNTPTVLRRYTMKDIGLLDKRISNLEYYTSLSILENQVSGLDVTDANGENILFKNGFLVDGFTGSSVADVQNPDYAASIDKIGQLARPLFSSTVPDYTTDINQGTFKLTTGAENNKLFLSNNIVTFSYTETPLVFQNVASQIVSVNPFDVASFIGDAILTPTSDVWYDTQSKPIVNVTSQDQAAWIAAVNKTGNGSQWNDWELNWSGQSTDTIINESNSSDVTRDTLAIADVIASKGLQAAISGGPVQTSSTTKVISSDIVPIARSIPVKFTLRGMAPFTKIFTFINGSPVSRFVKTDNPAGIYKVDITNAGTGYADGNNQSIITVTGNSQIPAVLTANVSGGKIVAVTIQNPGFGYTTTPTIQVTGSNSSIAILTSNTTDISSGTPLYTDINGYASGTLTIPNDSIIKFPSGTLNLEWSDNRINPALSRTYAKASFYSRGTLDTVQTTVTSTRPPKVTPKPQKVEQVSQPPTVIYSSPAVVQNPASAGDSIILASVSMYNDGTNVDKFIIQLSNEFVSANPGTYSWAIESNSPNFQSILSKLSATSGSLTLASPSQIVSITTPHDPATLNFRITRAGYADWTGQLGINERASSTPRLDSPLTVCGYPETAIIKSIGQDTVGGITVTNLTGQAIQVSGVNISRPTLGSADLTPSTATVPAFGSAFFSFRVSSQVGSASFSFGFLATGYSGGYPVFTVQQIYQPDVAQPPVITLTTNTTSNTNTSIVTTNVGSVTVVSSNTTIDDVTTSNTSSNTSFTSSTGAVVDTEFTRVTGSTTVIGIVGSLVTSSSSQNGSAAVILEGVRDSLSDITNELNTAIGNLTSINDISDIVIDFSHTIWASTVLDAMNELKEELPVPMEYLGGFVQSGGWQRDELSDYEQN